VSEVRNEKNSQGQGADTPCVWSNSWDQAEQRLTLLNEARDAGTRDFRLGSRIALVAPGGAARIEEFDLYAIKAIGSPAYAAAWGQVVPILSRAGLITVQCVPR
jgi:hypothetical protein